VKSVSRGGYTVGWKDIPYWWNQAVEVRCRSHNIELRWCRTAPLWFLKFANASHLKNRDSCPSSLRGDLPHHRARLNSTTSSSHNHPIMPPLRPILKPLSTRLSPFSRSPQHLRLRPQSTYQPPSPPTRTQPPNPHGTFYKTFGLPLARTFLIAVATYQVMYISWSKLESMEVTREKEAEMRGLRGELEGLVGEAAAAGEKGKGGFGSWFGGWWG